MSKEGRLSRVGVLAPAALSACMDASVLAVPAAGAIVSTVLKELSKAFMLKKWFHGVMSSKEAEYLMMQRGKDGSYLVRESQTHPGQFVLSVRVRGRVTHVKIIKQQEKYDVGSGERFEDLVGLIEHCRLYPLTAGTGDVLRLTQPVSGSSARTRDRKLAIMQELKESQKPEVVDSGFEEEFLSLQLLENRQQLSTSVGAKPENFSKNRYSNIIPYDETRVILRESDGTSGYINANYIRLQRTSGNSSMQSSNESLDSVKSLIVKSNSKKIVPLVSKSLSDEALRDLKKCMQLDKINGNLSREAKEKVYIATQGCLPNTVHDFWKMVWQEDVRVIAMITKEVEKGKKKCERYWPEPNEQQIHNQLTVRLLQETSFEDYLVRDLEVRDNQGTCKVVYQYQFMSWPDHGVPSKPSVVISFIADINHKLELLTTPNKSTDKNVICVHCSAGVGRTGTYIALDTIIDQISNSGYHCDVDVFSTVRMMRRQRCGMVQNRTQYNFIHQAIHCYVDRKNYKLRKRIYTSNA